MLLGVHPGEVERAVLHVDLDQFIVAVELLRRPELRGRPVLVGGTGDPTERGVVAGASYEARARGVRSGTPLRTAAARCPDATFLPLDRHAYSEASARFFAALSELPVLREAAGWDEAFLLVEADDADQTAGAVQELVRERTGLNCSVGIGDNKLRAKLASGMAKPAGVFRLDARNWQQVMADRPTDALWGVGSKTAVRLARLGVRTVGELAAADESVLAAEFGPTNGPWLAMLAHGWDASPVTPQPHPARSRGREVTFQHNTTDWAAVRAEVRRLARQVAADLAEEEAEARRVVVKVRWAPFVTRTHGVPVEPPSRDASVLEGSAIAALAAFGPVRPVRLVGVRAEVCRRGDPSSAHASHISV